MSMEEVFASYKAHWRNKIMAQTFGHLAPKEGIHYGMIVVAYGVYRNYAIIKDTFDVDNSPWLYDASWGMINRAFRKMEEGNIYVFNATLRRYKNGKIIMTGQPKKIKI